VRIYGARGVDELPAATKALKLYEDLGFGNLPVCMAKTHLSLSHDPGLKGRPTGFRVPIREVRLSAGAGFITPFSARCARCRACRPIPPANRSTSTQTATSWDCSRRPC